MDHLPRLRTAFLSAFLGLVPFLPLRAQQDNTSTASEMPPPTANDSAAKDDTVYSCLTIFTRVLQLVRQDYVDEDKVDYRALTYNALRGMLSGLDPHSQFMEPDSFKDMQDDTRSRYDGLGLIVYREDAALRRHHRAQGQARRGRHAPGAASGEQGGA